jgi:hypothetical protein
MYARSAEPSQPLQHVMMAPNRQRMPQQPMVLHSSPQQHGYDGAMVPAHRHSYDGAMMAAPQHSYGGPMSPHSYGPPMSSPHGHGYGGMMSPHQHSYGPPMSSPHGHGYGGMMSPHQGYGMQMSPHQQMYDPRVAPEPCYAQPPQAQAPQQQNMTMNQATNVQVNINGGKERVNHCCHCILTTMTVGFWLPFWCSACMCGCPTLSNCPCGN